MASKVNYKTELTEDQFKALNLLLEGKTILVVAKKLKIDPTVINNWFNADPMFIGSYNQMRISMWESYQNQLAHHMSNAVDRVAELVNSENESIALRAAVTILKLPVFPGGYTDPEKIADEIAIDREIREMQLR